MEGENSAAHKLGSRSLRGEALGAPDTHPLQEEQDMRRYQMWLAAGVLALGPGLTLAGPLSFLKPAPKPAKVAKPAQNLVVRGQNPNDAKAMDVAKAIRRARVGGKVQVAYQNGTAVLMGPVSTPQEAQMVLRAADTVEGVERIENRLEVAAAQQPAPAQMNDRRRAALQHAGFQPEAVGESVPGPMDTAGPGPAPAPAPAPAYAGPAPMAYAPTPTGLPSHHVYDQPNMPNYAWPSYAAYPNSAAVNYPQQYSASAWPYIGPFYPYPQVPLGWRRVELEWDDGYWQLNFRPRTNRWWWFLDYKNW